MAGNGADDSKRHGLRFECVQDAPPAEVVERLAQSIAERLGCDEVYIQLRQGEELFVGQFPKRLTRAGSSDGPLFQLLAGGASFQGHTWSLPLLVNDLQRARVPSEMALELAVRKVRSCGLFPLVVRAEIVGVVECFFTRSFHRWRQEELTAFDELSSMLVHACAGGGSRVGAAQARTLTSDELRNQYRRMARYGNVIIILTDASFKIVEAFGNTEQLLGVATSEMTGNAAIWEQLLDPRDRALLRRRILRVRMDRDELREEVRVVHQRSGDVRWMMLRALPQFSANGQFQGWEGFGIDITDRRRAQDALMLQNQRLEALFEVARALQGQTDPAVVTLKGLRALLHATGSRAGYGCFYHRERRDIEVVAAFGLSERYLEGMQSVLTGPSLLRHAIESRKGLLIENLQEDARAATGLAKGEDLRGCIVMPLVVDDTVFGAVTLFKREASSFTDSDFELVSAAVTQMTLAVRQAELFESQRRHTQALQALYRISHELSKHRSPREMAEHAFPILQQEFGLKRAWFGIINDQGTHIVGKSGFGPGVRRQLQDLQIELNVKQDFLERAISSQRPVVVEAGKGIECPGLNRVVQRLKLDTVVVIPLVSLQQVLGVLVVEPIVSHTFLSDGRLQLLESMANEMATVLMSRRFESKMSEALKMRMAGLLASGVAHNFNNLLQAVLGQVALIELQLPKGSAAFESTRTITEAAKRGATLVTQLLNFAAQGSVVRESVSINSMVQGAQELYQSLLSKRIELRLDLDPECPEVVADVAQLQQAIANLLANAKDAIGNRPDGVVTITTKKVRLRAGEVDPQLPSGFYIRIDIRDNGIGMDAEQQARCFEPFYTTKNVDRGTGVGLTGTGLGLSAAYSIVQQHEGSITVASSPREGATLSVYLPILRVREGAPTPELAAQARVHPHTVAGVMLLDFEAGLHPLLSSIFDSLGYRSRTVFDLKQLEQVCAQSPHEWGTVFIDLDNMSGDPVEVSKQLLARFPELRIVACSSVASQWGAKLMALGRVELLEKPLGVWSVEDALKRLRAPTVEMA